MLFLSNVCSEQECQDEVTEVTEILPFFGMQ